MRIAAIHLVARAIAGLISNGIAGTNATDGALPDRI
jgi:hypothetical protein